MNRSFLLLMLIILSQACNTGNHSATEKPVVSVSILPQKYFLEQLAGDLVEVNVMIPPGANPATYEPTISQLGKLDRSELYFRIGYVGFELSWMEKIRSVNPEMEVVDLSSGIQLIHGVENGDHGDSHHHGGTDPHIWMSARNAGLIASNMYEALTNLLPDQKEKLTSNLEVLLGEIESLDKEISRMMAGLDHRSFMIYHPALTYFARDYSLEQLPLELEGKNPSPAHMKKMADLGRMHHIKTIFLQKQFDQKNAQVLAAEIGARVVFFDPLAPDWNSQMLFIAAKLKETL
ncbi:MAG: zinc ABC transporter substrate-binding protein [Bacteroidota bacterium]